MSANIKKFIIKLLSFIPFVFAIYIILVCFWGEFGSPFLKKNLFFEKSSSGLLHTRLQEVKKTNNIDLLVLGSSHAYRGFDPRKFKEAGISMFNLGSSAQTATQTEILVDKYIDKLNPKIILYEVYPNTFSFDGVESALDLIANEDIDSQIIKMCFKMKHILVINTLIYASYREILNEDIFYIEKAHDGDTYISGGFVEKTKVEFNSAKHGKSKWEFNKSQFDSFERVLNKLKKKGIKVYLINAPIPNNYYKSVSNNAEFDKIMQSYGTYYNFNGKVDLNDSIDFYDSTHLNQTGVVKFNEKLIATIFKK
jgi:hypothetical protein